MSKERILVVDDEPSIVKFVGYSLKEAGYEVVEASDGEQALGAAEQTAPKLIILDIGLPKLNGFEVCQRIREWSHVPIIILSARPGEEDKVQALNLGADDYLVKPFGINELIARVEAVLRRTGSADVLPTEPVFVSGDLRVDFDERRVTSAGQEVKLTPTEYRVLRELIVNHGKVLTHTMLLRSVWGPEYANEREYLHVVINKLRRKIDFDPSGPRIILTVPGVGYRFESS